MSCGKEFEEASEEREFGRVHFLAGCFEGEESGPVDFGECLVFAGARGPFHFKCVAADRDGVAVAFERPRVNDFAGLVLDGAERD